MRPTVVDDRLTSPPLVPPLPSPPSISQRNPIDESQVPNNQPKPRKGRPKRTIIQDSSNKEPKGTTNDDVMSQDSVLGTLKAEGLLMICKLLKLTIDLM